MKHLLRITFLFLFFRGVAVAQPTFTQVEADWNFRYEFLSQSSSEFDVFIDIVIPEGFHLYSFDIGEGGPIAASVNFTLPPNVKKIGGLTSVTQAREYFDDIFELTVRDFAGKATWKQRFSTNLQESFTISGSYSYQLCQDNGVCTNPFPEKFSFTVQVPVPKVVNAPKTTEVSKSKTEKNIAELDSITQSVVDTNYVAADSSLAKELNSEEITAETTENFYEQDQSEMSLLWIFIFGFLGGLLAFLTPCVFPMVPMTVSMFIKRSKEKAVRDVSIYGLSIVGIYVALGILITILFGVDALNKMSTSPWFNGMFFLIFLLFAISFFGAFELVLPASWINFIDKKADTSSGFLSIFFMAFTLVLVSFSCTAMIIGTLLVQSVVSGSLLGPFMGMLGFSIALALPFVVFAFVPSLMTSIGKSGSWLQTVKVTLGFIELGFALKFISKADLVAGWGILPRDLFLAIWIVLLVMLGLYILKKIRFALDDDSKEVSTFRFLLAMGIFSFALYLVPGMFGAPLKSLSGYLPPLSTQTLDLYTPTLYSQNSKTTTVEVPRKYSDVFSCPHNLQCFFDYDEGMTYAKQVNKPVLLDFTGKGCENCRKIEMNVWSDAQVLRMLHEDYVIISLYVDARDPLEPALVRTERYGGKDYEITTIGEHWSMFMMQNYGGLMQPYYVLLSPEGKRLAKPITYFEAQSVHFYTQFLSSGIAAMKE